MAAADVYPAALFEIFEVANELNSISEARHRLELSLDSLVEEMGLYPRDMSVEQSEAFWKPFHGGI